MQASELRIGNHITPKTIEIKNFYTVVLGVLGSKVLAPFEGKLKQYSINYFTPIPLTNEWLVKLGGRRDNYGLHQFINKDCELWVKQCKHKGKWVFDVCKGEVFEGEHLCYIKYVHQLQNIYFALTGEELKYRQNENKANK